MNQIFKLMVLFVPLLFILACENPNEEANPVDDIPEDMDLETYLQEVELPPNFSIDFDRSAVNSVDATNIHTASILDVDEDKAIDELLRGEIIATRNLAEGQQFEVGDEAMKEYLTVYDGGESLGMNSGANGGLTYGLWKSGEVFGNKLSKVVANTPGPPGNIGQKFGYNLKSDYASFVDLSFMNYRDALTEIKETSANIGFPEIEVAEAYSVDVDTMLEHYEIYLDSRSYFGTEESDEVTFSMDDETYLFFFRQVIDDIPLSNVGWQEQTEFNTEPTNEITSTSMTVYYTKDGIRDMNASNFFDIKDSGEMEPLISGVTALDTVVESYSDLLIDNETKVFSMELCYVAILKGENSYELVPAWMFGIAQTSEFTDGDESKHFADHYSYRVIDAITGERIERASDVQ